MVVQVVQASRCLFLNDQRLQPDSADAAAIHLFDEETGTYNVPFLEQCDDCGPMMLINLFSRDLGLMVAPGNPLGIQGLADLARPDVRFINRQVGSGTRVLLDYHLRKAGVDPGNAAIAEPISSCLNAQERGRVGLGDTVVIIGSGPIGCIHIALARLHGADRIIIADINAERLKMAEPFAPDATVDVSKVDLVSEVRRLTNGRGADVIVTATPAPTAVVQAVEMARKGGRILLFGGLPKDDCKPPVDMNIVHYNALFLIGTTTFAPRHYRLAVQLTASNRIPVDKLITHRMPLADFKAGAMMALEGKVLKAVFVP